MSTSVTAEALREVALSREEYDLAVRLLGREPNTVELGVLGAMWSEHCGYKNSRPILSLFPSEGPAVLQGPGENAGAVRLGGGLAAVFKVESHNHPSAIEPYQGAATGVGGIVRDIFTMGARPVALLNSLRFGPLEERESRMLLAGVVRGIGDYGNSLGIPTVGGEIGFSLSYRGNPLVNAMCVGVAPADGLVRGLAGEPGNVLLLVGADTGRDGIHGATFASVDDPQESHRGVIQVGNPFMEKLLMEACLELLGSPHVVGMQDLGAAGLTSSSVECAGRTGSGVEMDVSQISRRETGMTPYEVMLSESQERMLLVVTPDGVDVVRRVFEKWDLHSDAIGVVTGDGLLRVRDGAETVCELPVHLLTEDVPRYTRDGKPSTALLARRNQDITPLVAGVMLPIHEQLLTLLGSPNIGSKRWAWEQYDHTIQTSTTLGPGAADAAVIRVRQTGEGLALTMDCNSRHCLLDPYAGGMGAVVEAARNLACVGARPLGLTNCLNFGNPEKPEVYWHLSESIRGMSDACTALGIPVVSGNVSLYNESEGQAVNPTPVVGMVGSLPDVTKAVGIGFREGCAVYMLSAGPKPSLAGSEWLAVFAGAEAGLPSPPDLDGEARLHELLREGIDEGWILLAHDVSDGGFLVALAECAIPDNVGLSAVLPSKATSVDHLFGEAPGSVIVGVRADQSAALETRSMQSNILCHRLGVATGRDLAVEGLFTMGVEQLRTAHSSALAAPVTTFDR
ncbi:MAG: phosphoribosylformylglycinamidine synthase subunit PurL [Chloroflexota bacterium]|nr:phosphoribosylformylglycinamidine synthase subunit PurL [Chloroflexota bacterium]